MKRYLWLVIDHTPDKDIRRGPELVACGIDCCPESVVNVDIAYAENIYIGEHDGQAIYPWTEHDYNFDYGAIWQEQEREQRGKRGE